jgi:DNA-binding Lrp family transcriptional regulator
MRDLDETDRELVRLLLADARSPYSELAEAVDLSPPAVSDRIDRLREIGVIRRFTLELDRSRLDDGRRVAATLDVSPGETTTVREALADLDGVEQVYTTASSRVFVVVTVPDGTVEEYLSSVFATGAIRGIEVSPLVADDRYPGLGDATLRLECVECGNTVTSEGVVTTIGGDRYEFCCRSCESRFKERYESVKEGL